MRKYFIYEITKIFDNHVRSLILFIRGMVVQKMQFKANKRFNMQIVFFFFSLYSFSRVWFDGMIEMYFWSTFYELVL